MLTGFFTFGVVKSTPNKQYQFEETVCVIVNAFLSAMRVSVNILVQKILNPSLWVGESNTVSETKYFT